MERISILFLIRALPAHGAERQLLELIKHMDKTRFAITVATLYSGGQLWSEMAAIPAIQVASLHKQGRWDILPCCLRLLLLAKRVHPRIIHGYLMESNHLAFLLGRLMHAKVIWGIRSTNSEHSTMDWLDRCLFRCNAWLSRYIDLVIYNSETGKQSHLQQGYSADNALVIPNGFDIVRFAPDRLRRRWQRQAWNVPPARSLIGIVGRLHPIKGHPTFFHAAAALLGTRKDVSFVCVGHGDSVYVNQLRALTQSLALDPHLIWVDQGDDMPALYNALDILVSTSIDEACPNVVGEAMACGTPCVVTDVGDARLLTGDMGVVVPGKDIAAIAQACERLLALPAEQRGKLAVNTRTRIAEHFTIRQLVASTQQAIESTL